MSALRCVLRIVGTLAAVYAFVSLLPFTHLTDQDFAAGLCVSALCVLGINGVSARQADQARDRARMRAYRDAQWQRRLYEARRQTHLEQRKAS